MSLRCLIVDDNHGFLHAARTLLERQDVAIAGVVSTSADALREAEALRPDVVLVDVSLGDESGLDLARRLAEAHAGEATIVLISSRSEAELGELVTLSPAAGFLPKSELSADRIRNLVNGR